MRQRLQPQRHKSLDVGSNGAGKLYRGIAVEGESVTFHMDVPNAGKDIQDVPVHWTLPRGKTVCKSLQEIMNMNNEELLEGLGIEEYNAIAKGMGYWCLGVLDDEELNEFKATPGTLGGAEWKNLNAKKQCPQTDMATCWWVVLTGDLHKPPRLLCHSLMQLKYELQYHRMADPTKLSNEWLRRCDHNEQALDVLEDYPDLWQETV